MTADLPTREHLDELVDTDPIKLRDEAYALRARVEQAETALFDIARACGADLDGAKTVQDVPEVVALALDAARDLRADYDETGAATERAEADLARSSQECAAVRQQLTATRMELQGVRREAEAVAGDRDSARRSHKLQQQISGSLAAKLTTAKDAIARVQDLAERLGRTYPGLQDEIRTALYGAGAEEQTESGHGQTHLPLERVIEVALGLYDGPRTGKDAPPTMAKAVLAALAECGLAVIPDTEASRCFRLDHESRLAYAEEAARRSQTTIARFRAWLDTDFRQWCSPHGIAARYATDLIKQLDRLVAEEQTGGQP